VSETQKGVIQLSRKGLLILGGLFFFIAGWMFVLGILVGRGTTPVNLEGDPLEKELAELKNAVTTKQQAEIAAETTAQKEGKPDLGFYKALKEPESKKNFKVVGPGKQTQANQRARETAQPKQVDAPPPVPAKPQKQPVAVKKSVKKPSQPSKSAAPKQGPASDAASSAERFTIQVAALKQASGADKLVDTLRKKGYPAYQIRSGGNSSEPWYRVRVGAFKDRDAAADMLNRLQQDQYKGLIVATK
jgi:cell division septation protein DedD